MFMVMCLISASTHVPPPHYQHPRTLASPRHEKLTLSTAHSADRAEAHLEVFIQGLVTAVWQLDSVNVDLSGRLAVAGEVLEGEGQDGVQHLHTGRSGIGRSK